MKKEQRYISHRNYGGIFLLPNIVCYFSVKENYKDRLKR